MESTLINGGSLSSGLNLLKKFDGTTTVVTKDEVIADKDGHTLVVAYIRALDAIKNLGKPIAAVNAFKVIVQQGSLSTIVSCVVANELNLKVVDGWSRQSRTRTYHAHLCQ